MDIKKSLKDNLPAHQAKINILRAIDDAASSIKQSSAVSSQVTKSKASVLRDIKSSKLTAQNVLGPNLTRNNLDDLNKSHTDKFMKGADTKSGEVGRSVKSEYDYGSKTKFVDVL